MHGTTALGTRTDITATPGGSGPDPCNATDHGAGGGTRAGCSGGGARNIDPSGSCYGPRSAGRRHGLSPVPRLVPSHRTSCTFFALTQARCPAR